MKQLTGEQYARRKYITLSVREPMPLMEFLMKEMSGISRNRVKDLLAGHAIMVDRQLVTRYDFPLEVGQTVLVSRHKRSTELRNKYVKIIYEDKDIIVIEKSEGILSMASAPGQYCVKTILDEYFRGRHFPCTAHVVHRLDRDTSGLMIYAKSPEARKILEENWHNIVFDRRYVAVLCGEMKQEGGTVHSWLKDNKAYVTYSSPVDNGGKEAITHYRRIATNRHYTLAEMRLETGRKNQIRVHMKDLGYPVAGDDKYGYGPCPLHRLALHAFRLYFYHPKTGELMKFETPYPTAFAKLFENPNNQSL
ncbi:MAG: RluA family pseudouridine synthase [Bacteroidaceae bacterium]|nr:RluA family pseudouridine synthase [Bacteroidaceae bacterium]